MRRSLVLAVLTLPAFLSACSGTTNAPAETPPQPQAPVVTLTSSAGSTDAGHSVTLTWTAANATSCVASGGWSGSKALTGTEDVIVQAGANSFTLTCMGDAGDDSATVTVTGTTTTPPPVPTVTLSSNTPTAAVGKTATLTWSSTDATGCVASGDWSGDKAASGNDSVNVIHSGPNSFTLTCTGAGGSAAQTLNVIGVSKYDLAGGCYAVKSLANGKFVNAQLTAAANDAATAEPFRMQAAGLGRYVFYTHDGKFLTAGSPITAGDAPADGSDWTFDTTDGGRYVVESKSEGKKLTTDGTGALVMGATAGEFGFVPMADTACAQYPEMPLDIGQTYKGNGIDKPVIGFAEVHSHMGMGSEMSDGAPENHVGPSAGGVMYGQAMNRFGVIEALKDCSGPHGQNGVASPEWAILDGGDVQHAQHETQGWPTFVDWPKGDSQLHQQMYWRWVERAYRAGLRIMTIHGTNIEALCNIAKETGGNKDTSLMDEDCTDMGVGMKQVAYLSAIQDYVDAQNGGPGKGWFRIVKDPQTARAVINDGKLAVVPGLEFSNMFGCNVTFTPDGKETDGCTKEQIDAGVEDVWNKGVRQIIPYHDVDSALGGTGIFSSVLNYVGFSGTHGFWKTYPCPTDKPYFNGDGVYTAGADMESANFTMYSDPITKAITDFTSAGGVLPVYGPGKQCNARGMTELGVYAVQKIMAKGFVLDVDHAELKIKGDMLDLGAKTVPAYPMLSAHGGHGGISMDQAKQLLNQGGLMYPALPDGKTFAQYVKDVKAIWPAGRTLAVGYGTDANGLRNLPGPRGGTSTAITYPFTLFKGPGWGDQYDKAGIKPIQVDLLKIEGGQTWNPDVVGTAHYGLVADFIEAARIEGGQETTDALYNSAEAYLEMWEQVQKASAYAKAHPPTLASYR